MYVCVYECAYTSVHIYIYIWLCMYVNACIHGTCATGCPVGVPGKQAGSSPIVASARRGWGRDSCPLVCQPRVVRARRTTPERQCLELLEGVTPRRVARELKSSSCGDPRLEAGGQVGAVPVAVSSGWHPRAPRGGILAFGLGGRSYPFTAGSDCV